MNAPRRSGPQAHRGRAPMAEINVTPLVDVMLVLLIIFMVTAPLLTAGVPVNLPDSRARPLEQDQKPVEVALNAEGKVFIDKEEVSDAALPGRLAELAARAEQPQIYFRADRAQNWDRVARAMGEINRAGLKRLAIITDQDAGG